MSEYGSKDYTSAQGSGTHNLYLVLLKFRFPPMNMVQEAPNILTYIPLHADSLLLFADTMKDYKSDDWRYDFIKITLFHKFNKECPESLCYSKEYGVPLSSVLIPVSRREGNRIELYLSTKYPRTLLIMIEGGLATLDSLYRIKGLTRQERLWIRKRDDIAKLALTSTEFLNVKGVVSGINSRRGGYRAINLLVKIPLEYLSTEFAFFASISDYEKLIEELKVLKKSGVGKKRDMGFGDLISWKVYKVKFNKDEVKILNPMILCVKEHSNPKTIITLRNLPAIIINKLRRKNKLSIVNMKIVLSRTRPPYWVRESLCLMPFSEFLLHSLT